MDNYLRDKVYLSNAIAILLEFMGISFSIISFFFAPKTILLPIIGGILCGLLVFFLNQKGFHTFSRVLVAIFPSITSTLYIAFIVQNDEPMINSLYFIALTFGLFVFLIADQREPKVFMPLIIYAGLLFFFMEKLIYWIDVPMSSSVFRHPILESINYFIGVGMLFYLMSFLLNKNLTTERQNLELIQALEFQKNEVATQNEELHQQQEEMQAQRDFIASKNDELSQKNKQIQNSIQAASTIQRAVLPSHERLSKYFADYFLIYQPKDVVSGDFYWVTRQEKAIFLIAVDCTGHGVPGAFMTLIANNLLNQIIRIGNIEQPADILQQMHEDVKLMLHQKETNNTSGMDAVVVRIVPENTAYEIQMAGAKTGLFYKLPETKQLIEIKGTRKSIGGFQDESSEFQQESFTLSAGSVIYLGSDGLEDQNNLRRKKFTRRQIRYILEENADATLQKQKEALQRDLARHMQGTKQRDDILWMGIKL
ncbi:hypothetical protein BKI52_36745 [marine bacterium AO1-C]|nr:hypothetical protein BKI52_36745 [marine bacterium AO1-C]